jgi:uncharacterized protein with von Willebrand factor type A (vWA) domain
MAEPEEVEGSNVASQPLEVHIDVNQLMDDTYHDGQVDEEVEKKPKPSKTALELDQWSLRRGREVLAESELLQGHIGNRPDAALIAADMLAAAWEPEPQLAAICEDQARGMYFRALLQNPAYHELHAQTQFSDVASEIAAAEFAQGYAAVAAVEMTGEAIRDEAKVLQVAQKACKQAGGAVQDANAMGQALGVGLCNQHTRNQSMSAAEVGLLFKKIRENDQLQRIMRLAGRYRRLAQSRQRTKPVHGLDEICGIEPTGEIERLLPSELAMLDVPELELDLLRRITERGAMGYQFRGMEGEARGPIVILIDESGSMGGDRISHAKAIGLAMAWIARHQKRFCCLVSFSSDGGGVFLPMPGGECAPNVLLEWLGGFIGGGTDLTTLTEELPAQWDQLGCTDGKTDIIVITDCGLHCEDERAKQFNEWRRGKRARVETIVIGGDPGDMQLISDKIHTVDRLGVEVEEIGELMDV